MSEAELDEIREAFERYASERYKLWTPESMFGRNDKRYFDSLIEATWQAFQAGFKFAKGEK
jgi:hypothetical protein